MDIIITTINNIGGVTIKHKRYELTNETGRCYVSNEKLFRKKDFLTPYSAMMNYVTNKTGFVTFSIKYLEKDREEANNILVSHFEGYINDLIDNLRELQDTIKVLKDI